MTDRFFGRWLVLGMAHARRQNGRVVVLGQLMVGQVDLRRIPAAAAMDYCRRAVVWHEHLGYATEEGVHVDVRLQPGMLPFIGVCLGEGVLAVRQDADKDPGFDALTGVAVDEVGRVTGPVDLNLLTRLVPEMHGCLTTQPVLLDVVTELRVHEPLLTTQTTGLQILRPQELLVDAILAELLVDEVEVRQATVCWRCFGWRSEDFCQFGIGLLCRQRPVDVVLLGELQHAIDRLLR